LSQLLLVEAVTQFGLNLKKNKKN